MRLFGKKVLQKYECNFFSQYMGKGKIQNNLNFSLGATTVGATTVDATTDTLYMRHGIIVK